MSYPRTTVAAIIAGLAGGIASAIITTLVVTTLTATTANITTGNITSLNATTTVLVNTTTTDFGATTARITTLTAPSVSMTNATTTNFDATLGRITTIQSTQHNFGDVTGTFANTLGTDAKFYGGATTGTQDWSTLKTCQVWKANNGTVYYVSFSGTTLGFATSTSSCNN